MRPDRGLRLAGLLLLALLLSAAPRGAARAQQEPASAEEAFATGLRLHHGGLYGYAARAFERFRARYPDHPGAPEALYYEAEATLASGQEARAVRLFDEFKERYPAHPLAYQARLALGHFFFRTGQHEKAIQTFTLVLEDDPPAETAGRALYWMGASALEMGDAPRAIGYFRRAADEHPSASTAPLALYTIAYTHVEREEYEQAAEAFELLGARHPGSPYARHIGLALAEAYYELGDYRRAAQEIERRMEALDPPSRERALFLLAESHNQLRRSEDAILTYQRFLETYPESPYYWRAVYGLGWNYHREGAYAMAVEQFARVRSEAPADLADRALYYEGVNLQLAGEHERAAERFGEYGERHPSGDLADQALFELGMARYQLRRWDEAAAAFRTLLRSHADSPRAGEAYRMLGESLIASGNFEDALGAFDQAIARDAAPPELRAEIGFQKAWLLYRQGRHAQSAPAFLALYEAQERGDQAGDALFWAAESFYQTGQYDRSTRLFTDFLNRFKDHRLVDAAHYALGWTHFRQARYADAIREFQRFLTSYRPAGEDVPYRTDALLRLADSYYALKQYPAALRYYGQVEGDEAAEYALYQTGQAHANAGNGGAAARTFRTLLERYPRSDWREEAMFSLGDLAFQGGDYDAAIAAFQDLLAHHPQSPLAPKALYGIGDAHYNAGRLDDAVAAYRQVLERYPQSPFAGDAAAGIQFALGAGDDPGRAERIVRDFEEENPSSPALGPMRFKLAEAKYQSGRAGEAIPELEAYLRAHPSGEFAPAAALYLGSAYAELGDRRAARYLGDALDSGAPAVQADAARRLGRLHLAEERHVEALRTYERLEQLAGSNPRLLAEARYGQGMALLGAGRTTEAQALLERAADGPDAGPARLGLARIHEARGRADDALELYREVARQSQDETGAEALYRLGALLAVEGRDEEAISELSRMPVLFAGYPDWMAQGLLVQARAHRRLGRRGDADRIYDEVIADYPNTPHADAARREKAQL